MKMEQELIKKKVLSEEDKETLEILNNPEIMEQIRESEENIRKGVKPKKFIY